MSTTVSALDPAVLRGRIDRARAAGMAAGADALLIAPGSDLSYLLGGSGSSFERLTCLVLPANGDPVLVVPKLEAPGYGGLPIGELGIELSTWVDGDDPYAVVAKIVGADAGCVAVGDVLPALHLLPVGAALPNARQILAGPVLAELRMRKDAAEVAALREAGAAIDRVHARMGEWLRPGRTEAQVGADIADAIVAEGHDSVAFVIVGSGPNGASPHHDVSDRVIESGDVVVIDIGGQVSAGYFSDSTRVYSVGSPRDADVVDTYAVLQAAQAAAVESVRPGVSAQEVDAAARRVIADAGFGEYFIHRTGHGIGLDVHEHPYIVSGNDIVLEPGMAFSVEPGVYLPGRWGARIEDIVVVTDTGVESLNNQPHDLVVLPG